MPSGTSITAATQFNDVLDAVYQPKLANHEPNALLWNTKMAKKLSKTYLSDYSQLPLPRELQQLRIYETNQIPSYTRGTMSNVATDIFVGDFSELLVGTRMGLEVRVLTERYAENGQVALLATMRLDLALAHPLAFAVYRALGGS